MPWNLPSTDRELDRLMGLPAHRIPTPFFSPEQIVAAYLKLVQAHGGRVIGQGPFMRKTGIPAVYWRGRYWRSWSAFQAELGFEPNLRFTKIPLETLLRRFAELARDLGKLPTQLDIEARRKQDRSFPSSNPFGLVRRDDFLISLEEWCGGKPEFAPVMQLLRRRRERITSRRRDNSRRFRGIVYIERQGEEFTYTIRSARLTGKRLRQESARLGCLPSTVHVIDTDDPPGIERYWRERFKSRLLPGDIYRLFPEDLIAFRWRKFQ